MKIKTEFIRLKLKYPFKTARSAPREFTDSLIVSIEYEGQVGEGEIRPSEYYFGEDFKVAQKVISEILPVLGGESFPP